MTGTQRESMRQWMNLLLTLLFSLAPIVALGNDTVGSRITVRRVPTSVTPLHVTFTQNRLSLRVQNAPLKSLLEAIAHQTGLSISVSPAVSNDSYHNELCHKSRWNLPYRKFSVVRVSRMQRGRIVKSPHPLGKADEWELARLTIVAEGHGSPLAATLTSPSDKSKQEGTKRTEHQKTIVARATP